MAAGSGRWAVGGGLFWRVGVDSRRVVNSLLRWFFDALSVERRVFGRRGVTREGRWRPNGRFCSRLVDRERGKSRRDIVTPRRDIATTRRDDVTMRFSSLTAIFDTSSGVSEPRLGAESVRPGAWGENEER